MGQLNDYKRAMVVVAHADDAEFMCSGTVARWCAEGLEVVYVLCTDGSKGTSDPELTPEMLVKIRQREQRAAGRILGLKDVVFLGYPDAYLQPTLELRRDITREIRRHRPDVVICQSPVRNIQGSVRASHPDHLAAGEAALSAVYPTARDHLTFPELMKEGFTPHKVREVLIAGYEQADWWIDVSDYMGIAIKAIKKHKSQINGRNVGKRMLEWRSRAAEPHGMKYCEAFKRLSFS